MSEADKTLFVDDHVLLHSNPDAEGVYTLDEEWLEESKQESFFTSFVNDYPDLLMKLRNLNGSISDDCSTQVPIINDMLKKYLEKPELLDPHLEEIVKVIAGNLQFKMAESVSQSHDSDTPDKQAEMIARLVQRDFVVNCLFRVLSTLMDVRGYKTVVRYLPHDALDFEPVWDYLCVFDESLSQNGNLTETMDTMYGLLLWMSIIILVPFPLESIDSALHSDQSIVSRLLKKCQFYLPHRTKIQRSVSVLLGRLFSRPDFADTTGEHDLLAGFLKWCNDFLADIPDESVMIDIRTFEGVFSAYAQIFKHVRRDVLLPHAPSVLDTVKRESARCGGQSSVIEKLTVKVIQRITLVFLKPRVAVWRYQKSRQVLMGSSKKKSESSELDASEDKKDEKEEEMDEFAIPASVDETLDYLLKSLRKKNTDQRWSAAKGIGRICMRLTRKLADQIVDNLLDLLSPIEAADSWHGSCLCLAELARRGLLLPERLTDVVSKVESATLFDKFLGSHSQGDQVRDAACYVLWAFARAYDASLMEPFVNKVATSLVSMACFDREIHCRRAACAAFQENVGRQGHFPFGIKIVTAADFWSVSNRNRSYTSVAQTIARLDQLYLNHFTQHLLKYRLCHWDVKIRLLAAESLGLLTRLEDESVITDKLLPQMIVQSESANITVRHGALIGLAHTLQSLSSVHGTILSPSLQKALRNIIPKLEKARGYLGRGGDKVREAVCLFLRSLVLYVPKLDLSETAVDRYQQTIDDCLKSGQVEVQTAATLALSALSDVHYTTECEKKALDQRIESVTVKWCRMLKTDLNASLTRGYAKGLGKLSASLIVPQLRLVVDTLIYKTLLTHNPDTRDYLTRLACIRALADLFDGQSAASLGVSDEAASIYDWSVETDAAIGGDQSVDEKAAEEEAELIALGVIGAPSKKSNKSASSSPASEKRCKDEVFQFAFDKDDESKESSTTIPTELPPMKEPKMILFDRVLSAMINRFEDYEVDRRGDVGSFVREHSLICIARVMVALHSHSESKDSSLLFLRQSALDTFMCHLLRQLAEKLDRVRRAGGLCLEWMFDSCSDDRTLESDFGVRKDFSTSGIRKRITDHSVIAHEFGFDKEVSSLPIDWAVADQVFPRLVRCMRKCPLYRRSIVEGLLQSLGALSSDMSSMAMKSIRPFLEDATVSELRSFGSDLCFCVNKRGKRSLFQIPFFKGIGSLLLSGDWLLRLNKEDETFANDLLKAAKCATFRSEDIRLLMPAVEVFIGLCLFDSTRISAMQKLLVFLGYKFPKLRRLTADKLYGALQTWDEQLLITADQGRTASVDEIADYLVSHSWSSLSVKDVRTQRDEFQSLLSIPKIKK